MALPSLVRKLFENDGYGPHLNPSIVPFASSLASYGAEAATSQWVKDLSVAPIYVDGSVGSSGDGLSPSTAVKTIHEALTISSTLPQRVGVIYIAGNTYTDDIDLSNGRNVYIILTGNVTLTGSISVGFNATLLVGGPYSLTVNSNGALYAALRVSNSAVVDIRCTSAEFTSSNSKSVISIYSSKVFITSTITVTANAGISEHAINVYNDGYFECSDTLNIANGSYKNAINISNGSTFICGDELTVNAPSSTGSSTVYVNSQSFAVLLNGADIKSGTTASNAVLVQNGSNFIVYGSDFYSRINNHNGHNLRVSNRSYAIVQATTFKLDCETQCTAAIVSDNNSVVNVTSPTLWSAGHFNNSFAVVYNGAIFELAGNMTIANREHTSGRRYYVDACGVIDTAGQGDILPGTTGASGQGTAVRNGVYY